MPDYIYLLENRLSADQQNAIRLVREAAREAEMIHFLTGDAVRDLTSGHAVRELEVAVHGNALKLKETLQKYGGTVWGEDQKSQSLYLCFPGTVRLDLVSTHAVEYKKPGQPTYHFASIQEDLRRRDFTVNAMAISLNEGSYGLLMDPLNGVADIEARTLRLVSNYGFLEEPALMIRATRYRTRLGWELDPRTQTRYENARSEDVIQYLSPEMRSRELEQIGHEDDALRVLQAYEAEGWMKVLCPQWTVAKADEPRLRALHDLAVELLLQGVHPDMSAAQMQLLTAKMTPKDLSGLKKSMLRPGFVEEWNSLDKMAAEFQKVLLAKENQTPSTSFKLFTSYDPEAVLWLGFTSKDKAVQEHYHNFLKVWPEVRQRIPYGLMQEMRIHPELPNYNDLLRAIFLELIDGKLTTAEEMRAFLEPYSPPAPPPQVTVKRPRGRRAAEPKVKDFDEDEEAEESESEDEEDLDDMGADEEDEELDLPKIAVRVDDDEEDLASEEGEEEAPKKARADENDEEEEPEVEPKRVARGSASVKGAKHTPEPAPLAPSPAAKHEPAKAAAKTAPAKIVKAPAKVPSKGAVKQVPAKAKAAASPAKAAAVKKATLRPPGKPAHKSVTKVQAAKPHAPKGAHSQAAAKKKH